MLIQIAVACCWLSWGATGQHYQIETSPHLTSPRTIVSTGSVLKKLIEEESSTLRPRRDDSSLSYGVYPLMVDPPYAPLKSGLVPIVQLDVTKPSPYAGMIDHGSGIYSFSYSAGDHARRGPPQGRLTSFYYIANEEGMGDAWRGQDWSHYGTGRVGVDSHGDTGLLPEYGSYRPGQVEVSSYPPSEVPVYRPVDVSTYRPINVSPYKPINVPSYKPDLSSYKPKQDVSSYRPKLSNGPYRPVHLAPVHPSSQPPSPFSKPVFIPNTEDDICQYPDCYLEEPLDSQPPSAYSRGRGGTSRALFTQRPEVQYRVTKRAEPKSQSKKYRIEEPKVVVISTAAPKTEKPKYISVTIPSRTYTPRVITPRAITPRTFTSRTVTSKSSTVSKSSTPSSRSIFPRIITARSTTPRTRTFKTTEPPKMVTAKAILITPPQPSHTMRIKSPKKHVQKIPPPKNNATVTPSKNILHSFTILARNGLNKNIHAKDEEFYISSANSN